MEESKKRERPAGEIRVAKYYTWKAPPSIDGYLTVLIHTNPSGIGGPLSPYHLRDEDGVILENRWQFGKLYACVSEQRIPVHREQPDNIVWEHKTERHVGLDGQTPNEAYFAWRQKGFNNPRAVRWPNGVDGAKKCLGYYLDDGSLLGYVEARKRVYCALYARLAPRTESFQILKRLHEEGKNLLIIEVDGPDPTLTHPPYDQISEEEPAMLMTEDNIKLLIEDTKKPFGHGFTIAALLLDLSGLIVEYF